jgi:hypothetical protein
VRYKEIPISGLLSYWLDEDKWFMSEEELGFITPNQFRHYTPVLDRSIVSYKSHSVSDVNFIAERNFKM